MVFLAYSKLGVTAFENLWRENAVHQLWVGGGVLSEEQLSSLRDSGARVTELTEPIRSENADAFAYVIDMIHEHHPDELLWVETVRSRLQTALNRP